MKPLNSFIYAKLPRRQVVESPAGIKDSRVSVSASRVGCPRGVMVKAMDCGIVVCEFVLQSRYYVHFRANTLS